MFGYALFVVSGVAVSILIVMVVSTTGWSTSGRSMGSAWVGAAFALFGLIYAGHRVPVVMAARSLRPVDAFRRPVAIGGAVLVAGIAIFGYQGAMGAMDATLLIHAR